MRFVLSFDTQLDNECLDCAASVCTSRSSRHMVHLITMAGKWPSATANVKPPCLTATARKRASDPSVKHWLTLLSSLMKHESARLKSLTILFYSSIVCVWFCFSLRNPVTAVSFRPVSAIINRPWTPHDEGRRFFSFCAFVWSDREKSSLKFKLHDAWHLGFFCLAALGCWIFFAQFGWIIVAGETTFTAFCVFGSLKKSSSIRLF